MKQRNILRLTEEVRNALNLRKPVVSLESTIISHGLPYPQNIDMAVEVESILRDQGVTPATCAFIDGRPHVGLTQSDLLRFAEASQSGKVHKVSRRDIGFVMANKLNGGTTISSTMILSHLAGIKFFATGGLGGVHRDNPGETSMDISADLTELGRTPVSVICAGPKSILDIPRTLEFLETQGVFVGTYNEDKKQVAQNELKLPGFYTRESNVTSPFGFDTLEEAARIVFNQQSLNLQSGNVFCIPPPKDTALSNDFITSIIDKANEEAKENRISGKQLTPYLLSKIAKVTKGQSVHANISLVKNNALAAATIAKSYYALEESARESEMKTRTHQSVSKMLQISQQPSTTGSTTGSTIESTIESTDKLQGAEKSQQKTNLLVVGSVALDTAATLGSTHKLSDSNIGTITNSIGGVGYNIALASNYTTSLPTTKFMSRIGRDFAGDTISSQLKDKIVTNLTFGKGNTAQYVCTHNVDGDLIIACADMSIIEEPSFADDIIQEIVNDEPRVVVLDCNLSVQSLNKIIKHVPFNKSISGKPQIVVEPTSHVKAKRLAETDLSVFPHNAINLITPTVAELNTIFDTMSQNGKFEDYDHWFPVVDAMGVDSIMREKLLNLDKKHNLKLWEAGVFQQSFHMLPYFQNILVKLGDKGVLLFSLVTNLDDLKSIPTTSVYRPITSVTNNTNNKVGVLVEYFPIPKENEKLKIVNVTGAGDTLVGYLAAKLANAHNSHEDNWLNCEIRSCEQVWSKWETIYKAQLASGLTLQNNKSVSPEIANL